MKIRLMLLRGAATAALLTGVLGGAASAFTPSGWLEIHEINVQQGSCTLIVGPDGTTVLLDAGDGGKGAKIVEYLGNRGLLPADGIDYTLSSHMHDDHLGGFAEIVAAGYDVTFENWDNGSFYSSSAVAAYEAAMATTTAGAVIPAVLGDEIALGDGARLTVVAVNAAVLGYGTVPGVSNENDLSVAVLVEYGDFDYLWAGDLGGGDDDNACTGRSTSQANVETPLALSLTPGGGAPFLSAEGVDVLHVNHHGSESSTNSDSMNLLRPEVAVIAVGDGQGYNWYHPRTDVVDNVLLAGAVCVYVPAAVVLQTEEGNTGGSTSYSGFAVGDVKIWTDGKTGYWIDATGDVSQGPDERFDQALDLPRSFPLDEESGGELNTAPAVTITSPANGSTFEAGELISFAGTAVDTADGDLSWSLVWTSDLGDTIGTGASFTATLSPGTHTVVASVTDSGSLTGIDAVSVTVGPGLSLLLSEVFYDAAGGDDGWEWVELYNAGKTPIDLSEWSLGNGGADCTYSKVQLAGIVAPGETFVVGGPVSGAANGNPFYDQVMNFNPDFQNSGTVGDAVALFDVPAASVTSSTVPVDAVIYGPNNDNGLIDETGSAHAPEVGDAPEGGSIGRLDLAGHWQIQQSPTPNRTLFLFSDGFESGNTSAWSRTVP